ncbi:MAG TPA: hypothetical protein VML55_24855 [Planctomycetaceae bacterium]|nr:hypothetical protein [Planctomycetaceae bacterium]
MTGRCVVGGKVREARELEQFLESLGELLVPLAALAVVLFAAAWVVVRVRARYRGSEDPAAEAHRMLTQLGDLRRRGGLSEAEYRSIQSRLAGRLAADGASRRASQAAPQPDDMPHADEHDD